MRFKLWLTFSYGFMWVFFFVWFFWYKKIYWVHYDHRCSELHISKEHSIWPAMIPLREVIPVMLPGSNYFPRIFTFFWKFWICSIPWVKQRRFSYCLCAGVSSAHLSKMTEFFCVFFLFSDVFHFAKKV